MSLLVPAALETLLKGLLPYSQELKAPLIRYSSPPSERPAASVPVVEL